MSPQSRLKIKNVKFGSAVTIAGKTITAVSGELNKDITVEYEERRQLYHLRKEHDDKIYKIIVHTTNVVYSEPYLEFDSIEPKVQELGQDDETDLTQEMSAEPQSRRRGRTRTQAA